MPIEQIQLSFITIPRNHILKRSHCRPTMLFKRSPNDSADSQTENERPEHTHTGRPGSKKQMDELMYTLNKAEKSLNYRKKKMNSFAALQKHTMPVSILMASKGKR